LDELNKDTMERDLWDLGDDGLDSPESRAQDVPEPAAKPQFKAREIGGGKPSGSSQVKPARTATAKPKAPPPGDFDDLDDDPEVKKPAYKPSAADPPVVAAPPVANDPEPVVEKMETSPPQDDDEFTPHAKPDAVPASLRPSLGLSKFEKIGLLGLFVVLIAGGAWFLAQTIGALPRHSGLHEKPDFPVKGELVTLLDATTYWRAPVLQGENADTVRRGTALMPVLELKTEGGPAAIRIFFRNGDGEVVGDPVTRSVSGKFGLAIPATAGFDDQGMHAAYRTGLSEPWTIEVLEAPSENSSSTVFRRLLKMNISPDRR
jgi:hypothetical protein